MEIFTIRTYGFQELAVLYFPNCMPTSASNQLKRWITKGTLYEKLVAAGYSDGQHILTPKQVRIIVEHLDPP